MTDQPPTAPAAPPTEKRIWTRWWMIVIYVIVALGLIGALILGDTQSVPEGQGATTTSGAITTSSIVTTTESPTTTLGTTTTAAPTTTVPPTTSTTLPPGWEPFTMEGSGDDFFEYSIPFDDLAVLKITHSGSSNFTVWSYTSANHRIDLLVNEIGSYEGYRPVNFLVGEEVGFLEVGTSGSWSITATYLFDLEQQVGKAAGSGPDVVIVNLASPALAITHDGDSNFSVKAWTTDDRDLLVNEIGKYSGTVRVQPGMVIFDIEADGNWSLGPG